MAEPCLASVIDFDHRNILVEYYLQSTKTVFIFSIDDHQTFQCCKSPEYFGGIFFNYNYSGRLSKIFYHNTPMTKAEDVRHLY